MAPVHRDNPPDLRHLHEILERFPAVRELSGQVGRQAFVRQDQGLPRRRIVAPAQSRKERAQFRPRQRTTAAATCSHQRCRRLTKRSSAFPPPPWRTSTSSTRHCIRKTPSWASSIGFVV